jgi:hypothetical protein
MATSTSQPPFFSAVEPQAMATNRSYRVYVLPSELIFIRAGSTGELTTALAAQFGLLGALIAAALNHAKKNQQRQEELNSFTLDQLMNNHKHNFRIAIRELLDARLDPYSFGLAVLHKPAQAGVFQFTHPTRGKVKLVLGSTDEMQKAVELLPSMLRERLTVNVEWNERKKRFVRKK